MNPRWHRQGRRRSSRLSSRRRGTIADVTAILDSEKPDPAKIAQPQAEADAAPPSNASATRRQSADPGISRAEALRQAMVAIIDGGGYKDEAGNILFAYAHPLFWAPYTIIGDGG